MRQMAWQLIEEQKIRYFRFGWQNNIVVYSTKLGEVELLKKFSPLFIKQIHSEIILNVDSKKSRTGDGLITKRKNFALGIKVADCLPIYLFSKEKICLLHCGWRSISKGIAKEASRVLKNYKYILGASIGSCCYEIQRDVAKLFEEKYRNALIRKGGKYYLDLKSAVIEDLGKESLLGSLDLCTKCHPAYFHSYRRGDREKRNYAIMLAF